MKNPTTLLPRFHSKYAKTLYEEKTGLLSTFNEQGRPASETNDTMKSAFIDMSVARFHYLHTDEGIETLRERGLHELAKQYEEERDLSHEFSELLTVEEARKLAEDPNLDDSTLLLLARHEDKTVRINVARNPKANRNVLAHILRRKNESFEFIEALIEHPETPVTILDEIAQETVNTGVLHAVIDHPRVSKETVERLLNDPRQSIKEHATESLQGKDN